MHLKINYQNCGELRTPDLLLYAAAFLPEAQHKEAVALDGLRFVFLTLEESSQRLENKLLELKPINSVATDISHLDFTKQIAYTSLISDVWILIDNVRRIPLFLKFIPGIPETVNGIEYTDVIEEIKHLRDSLHHIDERVKKYFSTKAESVFGDIRWRNRNKLGESEEVNFLFSGPQRIPRELYNIGELNNKRFLDRVGAYDLRITFVKRPFDPINKVHGNEERTEVNLENTIKIVNRLILYINEKYSLFYRSRQAMPLHEESSVVWPTVYSARAIFNTTT